MRWFWLALLLGAPAAAQTISPAPDSVSVTIYRDPARGQGAMDRNWPRGYALISEARTVRVPAGDSMIRFEGVAEGLLPETAIVTGLPKGVREKNRDARLLSPAGLIDANLKRRVWLARTDRATGKRTEQEAVIQAGPSGGVVLQTADGIEALGCAGLPERMQYDGVPAGLSAKPTLSVLTTAERATTVTVTLTYMAQGFDWSANYVARMQGEGKLGLFAWLTVANGGAQSFRDARMQVVAGRPNRVRNAPPLRQPELALRLRCWPMDVTSTHPRLLYERLPWDVLDRERLEEARYDVVVTGNRLSRPMAMAAPPPPPAPVMAQQENLGDLKLYRVPVRVTIAAQSQKQVAMFDKPSARLDRLYTANAAQGGTTPRPMRTVLRGRNVEAAGLGLPLPAGGVALFEPVDGQQMFAGEDMMADRAIGEEVQIGVGDSPDVQWTLRRVSESDRKQGWRADISNARPFAIRAEIVLPYDPVTPLSGMVRGPGGWRVPVSVPANGTATVRYRLKGD